MAMQKAKDLSEFYKVFYPSPLKEEDMDFYCENTMQYRTGDVSPIKRINRTVTSYDGVKAVLLLGHRGCGKSTELMKLQSDLIKEKYCVKLINCKTEMSTFEPEYWDFFILMTQKLIEIAVELDCKIEKRTIEKALSYWDDKSITDAFTEAGGYGIEAELSAGASLWGFFKASTKVSGNLKNTSETRTEIKRKVKQKSYEWIEILNSISTAIQGNPKSNGKMPILILEEIDKVINPGRIMDIFHNNALSFSLLPFKSIYTFPISLYYDERFALLGEHFEHEIMPMIKVHNQNMSENDDGIEIIKELIFKRLSKNFFNDGVLEKMIQKTGGALRHLFEVIINAADRADDRGMTEIHMEDVDFALSKLKSELTRVIEVRDYDFLRNVYNEKEQIEDREKLLKFMKASVVLEYKNGDRWHDVHPLIYDFLNDQGIFDE